MEFKVNLAKGTHWQSAAFTEAVVYGTALNGTAQWNRNQQRDDMSISGPMSDDGQNYFIIVGLPTAPTANESFGLLCRYQFPERTGVQYAVLAVNDLQQIP